MAMPLAGCGSDEITLDDLERATAKLSQPNPQAMPSNETMKVAARESSDAGSAIAEILDIEKPNLKIGFIKLTDCAPLVIAKENGYFEDEGLSVEIEAQSNWKILLDRVIDGQLDGAHVGVATHPGLLRRRTLESKSGCGWHRCSSHYQL